MPKTAFSNISRYTSLSTGAGRNHFIKLENERREVGFIRNAGRSASAKSETANDATPAMGFRPLLPMQIGTVGCKMPWVGCC